MSNIDLLNLLADRREVIMARITPSHLRRYSELQSRLYGTNVALDGEYQRLFNGYYRMQRRNREWYAFFFSLLEARKHDQGVKFGEILETIFRETARVEPSFCSKLVATIHPDQPVYDRYVRENLSLRVPNPMEPAAGRVKAYVGVYQELQSRLSDMLGRSTFSALRSAFDERFPGCVHFTDMKKLDLLLWQSRDNSEPLTRHDSNADRPLRPQCS